MPLRKMLSLQSGHESPVPLRYPLSLSVPSTISNHPHPHPHPHRRPSSTGPLISPPPLIFALNHPRMASLERILSLSPLVLRRFLSYQLLYPSGGREGARSPLRHLKSYTTSTTDMAACSSTPETQGSGLPIPPPTRSIGLWPTHPHPTPQTTSMVAWLHVSNLSMLWSALRTRYGTETFPGEAAIVKLGPLSKLSSDGAKISGSLRTRLGTVKRPCWA